MTLSDTEVARLRRLLWEIDKGLDKKRFKPYVETRTRNIRLMLTKARKAGTMKLATRISELIRQGYPIVKEWYRTPSGKKVMSYRLMMEAV